MLITFSVDQTKRDSTVPSYEYILQLDGCELETTESHVDNLVPDCARL